MDNHTSGRIIREAIPAPMPRRLEDRLAWLDHLEWCIANDVCVTYFELREAGMTADAAVDTAGKGSVAWIAARLAHAADVGIAFAQAGDREAA